MQNDPGVSASIRAERVEAARANVSGSHWRLMCHDPAPGPWNMAVDEAILEAVGAGDAPPTLRLYAWNPPALSLGRFQTPSDQLDLGFCHQRGWDVVRRPTGGRAVLHDQELTYSIVVPLALVAGVGVLPSYCLFSAALRRALDGLHPDLAGRLEDCEIGTNTRAARDTETRRTDSCFAVSSAADGFVAGRKLIGSAQVRRGNALLQHGSLLLDADRAALQDLFDEPGDFLTLRELLDAVPPLAELQTGLASGLAASLDLYLTPGDLLPGELTAVRASLRATVSPAQRVLKRPEGTS